MEFKAKGPKGIEVCVLIDEADYELVSNYVWHIQYKNGKSSPKAKAIVYKKGKYSCIYMHRLITSAEKGLDVDHINGDGLDNRKVNLRVCTRSQNHANRRRLQDIKTSVFKGVCRKKDKFSAQIGVGGKVLHLGAFDSEMDAARAYDSAAKEHFGDFAFVNGV